MAKEHGRFAGCGIAAFAAQGRSVQRIPDWSWRAEYSIEMEVWRRLPHKTLTRSIGRQLKRCDLGRYLWAAGGSSGSCRTVVAQ